jgi:hypothetical protein
MMKKCIALACVGALACSNGPLFESAPAFDTDATLDALDEGHIYNGWNQYPDLYYQKNCSSQAIISNGSMSHVLDRFEGDATRGGGACHVVKQHGSSCSTDSDCAVSAPQYGYCYSGTCYVRPGSQADECVMGPNRGAGSVGKTVGSYGGYAWQDFNYVLGCMTKTAGPNTACGGTNGSLYMRAVWPANYECD